MSDWSLTALKLVHIGALVFWIGPTLGAWWMLRVANQRFGEPGMVSQHLYRAFLRLLWVEHIAFVTLLASGASLAWLHGWFGQPWLNAKLLLVLAVVLPMELLDIWLGHVRLPRLFHHRHPSRPYSAKESALLALYHGRLTRIALWVMPLAVTGIIWLAVGKAR
jgi:hypothetical protein